MSSHWAGAVPPGNQKKEKEERRKGKLVNLASAKVIRNKSW